MSVFFNKAIASPVSENCCHDTSVSNVYIAAWQEIVKPAKVIELSYVCFAVRSITRYVGTEQSDRPGFMHKTRFSPFKPYTCSSDKLLAISMLWKCIRGKSATVAGRKTDKYISPRSESFH